MPAPVENIDQRALASPSKSWRDILPVHPAADLFPMMSEQELDELAADIKARGALTWPIVMWAEGDGRYDLLKFRLRNRKKKKPVPFCVLDGRNRLSALERLGWLSFDGAGWPIIDDDEGDWDRQVVLAPGLADPQAFVISANIHRRHLTAEQRRDLIAKVLKATPERSNRQIAEQVKADHKTVGAVRAGLESRGEIPHVESRTDSKARQQPASKPPAVVEPTPTENPDAESEWLSRMRRMWEAAQPNWRARFLDYVAEQEKQRRSAAPERNEPAHDWRADARKIGKRSTDESPDIPEFLKRGFA